MNEIIQGVSTQVGTYLPNIASAIGVLIVGWIIAHLLGRIARLAVGKTGIDNKIASMLGGKSKTDMSRVIGKIVYYIAMLFVFVTFFNVLNLPVVSEPLSHFLDKIFAFAPQAISAIVLGIVAWALATVGRMGSRTALETIDIDGRLSALGQDVSAVASTATTATDRVLNPGQTPVASLDDDDDEVVLDLDPTDDIADDLLQDDLLGNDDAVQPLASRSVATAQTETVASAATGQEEVKLSKTLPEAVYWLILFLFLPAILGALNMPGLLEPIQGMFEKALGYLPNIIGAGVILAVGFLVAKIIRQVVTNLTASFGVDRLSNKVGLVSDGSQTKLSGILGVLAYATVLLPILVAALNTLDIEAVTRPASVVLEQITAAIPGLIGGAVVLGISFFIAKLIAGIAEDVLSGVGFNELPTKMGLTSAAKMKSSPSNLAGKALTVIVMLLATMQALPMMGLSSLAGHLEQFVGFGTQVLLGLAILGLGVYLANMAAGFVRDSGVEGADKLATIARVAIIVFAGAMGLERMGLSTSIVNVAFGSLLGGLGIAAAIAFGWGGRDAAKRILDRYVS
jgi:hypothetical protein